MTSVEAVRPCLRAFCEDLALPSGVLGPVDFWALLLFAVICFSDAIF